MKSTTLKVFIIKWWNSIQINDIAITDVTGVQWFTVILPRENNKLLHPCNVIPCNTMNYLIRRQSERYIIISITLTVVNHWKNVKTAWRFLIDQIKLKYNVSNFHSHLVLMKWILNFHNFIIFKTGNTVVFQSNMAFNEHLLLNRIINVFK